MDNKSSEGSENKLSKKSSSNDFEMKVTEETEELEMMIKKTANSRIVISVDDAGRFPSVYLEPSPKGHRSLRVKIPMYKTTSFMKMETQVFVLDVTDPNTNR